MNYTKWFIKYSARRRHGGVRTVGKVTVSAMSANHAITIALGEIPREFSNVEVTTVHQLE